MCSMYSDLSLTKLQSNWNLTVKWNSSEFATPAVLIPSSCHFTMHLHYHCNIIMTAAVHFLGHVQFVHWESLRSPSICCVCPKQYRHKEAPVVCVCVCFRVGVLKSYRSRIRNFWLLCVNWAMIKSCEKRRPQTASASHTNCLLSFHSMTLVADVK